MMLPVAAGGVCVRFVGASVPEQFAAAVMGMVTVSVAPHALAPVGLDLLLRHQEPPSRLATSLHARRVDD